MISKLHRDYARQVEWHLGTISTCEFMDDYRLCAPLQVAEFIRSHTDPGTAFLTFGTRNETIIHVVAERRNAVRFARTILIESARPPFRNASRWHEELKSVLRDHPPKYVIRSDGMITGNRPRAVLNRYLENDYQKIGTWGEGPDRYDCFERRSRPDVPATGSFLKGSAPPGARRSPRGARRRDRPGPHLGQAAEPGRLPLGELPGPRLDVAAIASAGRCPARQVGRSPRDSPPPARDRARRPGARLQRADLLDQPVGEHRHDPAVDPPEQLGAGPLEGEDRDRPGGAGRPCSTCCSLSGRPVAAITSRARTTRRRSLGWSRAAVAGSSAGQPGVHRRVAQAVGLLLQGPTERRVGPGPLEQAPEQGLEVERRAADEQGPRAPGPRARPRPPRAQPR